MGFLAEGADCVMEFLESVLPNVILDYTAALLLIEQYSNSLPLLTKVLLFLVSKELAKIDCLGFVVRSGVFKASFAGVLRLANMSRSSFALSYTNRLVPPL